MECSLKLQIQIINEAKRRISMIEQTQHRNYLRFVSLYHRMRLKSYSLHALRLRLWPSQLRVCSRCHSSALVTFGF